MPLQSSFSQAADLVQLLLGDTLRRLVGGPAFQLGADQAQLLILVGGQRRHGQGASAAGKFHGVFRFQPPQRLADWHNAGA
jgi:hypothetical protein